MGEKTKPEPVKPDKPGRIVDPPPDAGHSPPSTADVDTMIESARRDIHDSFGWLASGSQAELGMLKDALSEKNEPPFIERLARGALEAALLAGPAAAGEVIAGFFLGESHKLLQEGGREFVKAFFEEGIVMGVELGREKLAGHGASNPLARFIDAQKDGVQVTQNQNQVEWNNKGRLQVRTLDEAQALQRACSPANVKLAARKQYDASRDAWVSYLAQARYGEIERPVAGGELTKTTTNMATQEQRDRTNASAPGFVPSRAPNLTDAIYGRDQGVLTVVADLPEIKDGAMSGTPEVKLALLNGVNDEVRSQYEWKPIGDLAIPRQINARVKGDAPNFTINVDEAGLVVGPPLGQSTWLRDRAVVGHPENSTMYGLRRQAVGTSLLLKELVVGDIKKWT